jgi:hypothetical protein
LTAKDSTRSRYIRPLRAQSEAKTAPIGAKPTKRYLAATKAPSRYPPRSQSAINQTPRSVNDTIYNLELFLFFCDNQ